MENVHDRLKREITDQEVDDKRMCLVGKSVVPKWTYQKSEEKSSTSEK
jgi:hypothetical protein